MAQKYVLGQLLSEALSFCKTNKKILLQFALLISVLGLIVTGIEIIGYEASGIDYIKDVVYHNALTDVKTPLPNGLWTTTIITTNIIFTLFNIYISLAIFALIYLKTKNPKATFKDAQAILHKNFWRVIGTGFLEGILLILLFLLLIIPGIIFAVYWVFVPYIVFFREQKGWDIFKRSKEMVKDNWGRTLGYGIIIGLLVLVINTIISLPFLALQFLNLYQIWTVLLGTFLTMFVTYLLSYFSISFWVKYFLAREEEMK